MHLVTFINKNVKKAPVWWGWRNQYPASIRLSVYPNHHQNSDMFLLGSCVMLLSMFGYLNRLLGIMPYLLSTYTSVTNQVPFCFHNFLPSQQLQVFLLP